MQELSIKNCPFCGTEAYVGDTWNGTFAVICCLCGCQTMHYRKVEDAVEKWNRRVELPDRHQKKGEKHGTENDSF